MRPQTIIIIAIVTVCLAGEALEVGGSGGFLKYGGFTKSQSEAGIRLYTVSAGPGVGGEVHGYLVGTKVQPNADLWPRKPKKDTK